MVVLIKPIFLIKFESEKLRNDVFSKRFNLKGTKLVLSEDYPEDVREERRILYKFYKQAKVEDKNVKFRYNYIILNSKKLFCEDVLNISDTTESAGRKEMKSPPRKRVTRRRT